MKKNQGDCFMQEYNGYKVLNQYIELLTLQKYIEIKIHFVIKNGNTQIGTVHQYIRIGKKREI